MTNQGTQQALHAYYWCRCKGCPKISDKQNVPSTFEVAYFGQHTRKTVSVRLAGVTRWLSCDIVYANEVEGLDVTNEIQKKKT